MPFHALRPNPNPTRCGKTRQPRPVPMSLEALDRRDMPSASPFAQPLAGDTISGLTPHTWVADSAGLYHTASDLKAEWRASYKQMLAGGGADLTPTQRLAGNAEAVFENTGLKDQPAALQRRAREDAQREFDAIAGAQKLNRFQHGIDPDRPLTERGYLRLEATLQGNPKLYELGLQGHGLNSPPAARYNGYTNDIQNNVDNKTLFVGGGLDNNEGAVTDFFDDILMTHTPFPVVFQNGELVQLNQNAANEDKLLDAVVATDDFMYGRVLTAKDFATAPSGANDNYVSKHQAFVERHEIDLSAKPENGVIHGLLGDVRTEIHAGRHAWKADDNGLFHTATDLKAEWQGYYKKMLAGHAGDLTPSQRLEGNAEAVFENTAIASRSEAQQKVYREDVQRQLDALAQAMKINATKYDTDPDEALTPETYLQLERTIQSNATLKELSDQGHGLNNAPAPRYNGFTNDFQNGTDAQTNFVGGGQYNNTNALADFFDNAILSHAAFPSVWKDGRLVQLNQNGTEETLVTRAVVSLDVSMYYRVYLPGDFARM